MFDRDLFNSCSAPAASRASMSVINALADYQPHEQLVAIMACAILASERYGVRPPDAMQTASNIMTAVEGRRAEFKAVERFMKEEWRA